MKRNWKKNCDATALEVTSSIPAGSFTIYKFIDEVFYLSKKHFLKSFYGHVEYKINF